MATDEKNMHEAYNVCPPASLPVQIESIACYGKYSTEIRLKNHQTNYYCFVMFCFVFPFVSVDNNVLLGTRQGHLLMYAVEQNTTECKMDLQLLQYDKNFSKKPITQIDVIPEYQLLFSLTDGLVGIHDIARHNFPLVHSNANTKGATLFALNVCRSTSLTGEIVLVVRLCVVIKRQLQFWYWKHDKLLQFREPIQLDDTPKAVVWLDNAICIGFKTDYILYEVSFEINSIKITLFRVVRTMKQSLLLLDIIRETKKN